MKRVSPLSILCAVLTLCLAVACSMDTPVRPMQTAGPQGSWAAKAPLPTPRSGVAGALYQNLIVVAGGECRDKRTYNEVEAYDLKAGRWITLAPLPQGRHGFGAAAVGRTLYFAAGALGCGGGERSDQLLGFSLP